MSLVLHKLTDWKRLDLRPRHSHGLSVGRWAWLINCLLPSRLDIQRINLYVIVFLGWRLRRHGLQLLSKLLLQKVFDEELGDNPVIRRVVPTPHLGQQQKHQEKRTLLTHLMTEVSEIKWNSHPQVDWAQQSHQGTRKTKGNTESLVELVGHVVRLPFVLWRY